MIAYLNAHLATFWFLLGFILLAIEVLAFGMASGVLLFAGIGAVLTGGLMSLGLLPGTWLAGIGGFAVCSSASAVLLWKPFKRIQDNTTVSHTPTSDLIGHTFRLQQPISHVAPGTTRYSGIEWRVELDDAVAEKEIAMGEKVEVVSVDAGIFRVRRHHAVAEGE
jgi:hypothetical protein